MKLLHDLRRRRMFRLAGLYIVGAWVVIQVAEALFQAWGIPETTNRYIFIAAALCFPIALVFGWIYDITSDGIVRTGEASPGEKVDLSLKRPDFLILTALIVVGIAIIAKSTTDIIDEIGDSASAVARLERSVAVLPFDSLDLNAETGVFSDGISAEILHRLSTMRLLNVIAAPSSFALRNSEESVSKVTEILGVGFVLQGSVRRSENMVRITANLLDHAGRNVWSQTFDRELEDIFVVQTEIASEVSSQILDEIVPLSDLPAGRTTDSLEAYSEFLIGKAYYTTRTPGWHDGASAAFRRALEFDDGFAPAWAGLAITLYVNNYGGDFEEVREYALRAIELDPDLAEGYAILGVLQAEIDRDVTNSIRNLRHAIELDPSFSHAYNWLGIAYIVAGMFDEARDIRDQGMAIDPLNPPLVANVAYEATRHGDPDRARALLKRLLYVPEVSPIAHKRLMELESEYGRHDAALEWARERVRTYNVRDNARPLSDMALIHEQLGMREEADYWIGQFRQWEQDDLSRLMGTTYFLRHRGDHAESLELLQAFGVPAESEWTKLPRWIAAVMIAVHIDGSDYETGLAIYEAAAGDYIVDYYDGMPMPHALDSMHVTAYGYRQTGQADKAQAMLDRFSNASDFPELSRYDDPRWLQGAAQHQMYVGDYEGAYDLLRRAADLGWTWKYWIENDPAWAETLARPEFQHLLAEVQWEIDRQRQRVEASGSVEEFRQEFQLLLESQDIAFEGVLR